MESSQKYILRSKPLNITFPGLLPTDPGLYLFCFWSAFKYFQEMGNSHSTDTQTGVLQERIHSCQESPNGRSNKELIICKNYCLFSLIMAVTTSMSLRTLIHTHSCTWSTCFPHFLPLTLWLHHKFTEAGNISWSLSKADNELLASLLQFHHITLLLIKMNKIIHVAQMSQCCLITNFPLKIKLGHFRWNIKTGIEEILPNVQ